MRGGEGQGPSGAQPHGAGKLDAKDTGTGFAASDLPSVPPIRSIY